MPKVTTTTTSAQANHHNNKSRRLKDLSDSSEDELSGVGGGFTTSRSLPGGKQTVNKENKAPVTAVKDQGKPSKQQPQHQQRTKPSQKGKRGKHNREDDEVDDELARNPEGLAPMQVDYGMNTNEQDEFDDEIIPETQPQLSISLSKTSKLGGSNGSRTTTTANTTHQEASAHGGPMTAREKKLQVKLDLTTKTLKEVQVSFQQLRELRVTRAEESEKALTEVATERQAASLQMIQTLQNENTNLRNELDEVILSHKNNKSKHEEMSAGSGGVSTSPANSRMMMVKGTTHSNTSAVVAELEELKKAFVNYKLKRDEEVRHSKQAKEELTKTNAALQAEMKIVVQERAAETQHSLSLQAKIKTLTNGGGSGVSSASVSAGHVGGNEAIAIERMKEHAEDQKMRLHLNEDLTGLQVQSIKQEKTSGGVAYKCILSDCLGKSGGLIFKLVFHEDGSVCYYPDVDEVRDTILIPLLPVEFRSFMRFDAEHSSRWFRTLFHSVNSIKE